MTLADDLLKEADDEVGAENPPASSPADTGLVTLAYNGPWYVQSLTVTTPDGDTLTIDRDGVEVDAQVADEIVESANANGVVIERKA